MSKHRNFLSVVTVSLGLLIGQMAYAQLDGPYPNYAPSNMNVLMSSHIANLSLQNTIRHNAAKKKSAKTSAKPNRTPIALKSTTYRANPAVTQKNVKQYIAWAKTQSPQEAAYVSKMFARYNPIGIWSGLVKQDGLHTGDVADALASYWILNYLISKQSTFSTRAQALAVRNQVRSALSSNPSFARTNQAQRQELAEMWMLNFVVQQGAYYGAVKRGDKPLMRKLAAAARTRFQSEMKVNLTHLSLTDKGFVPRT